MMKLFNHINHRHCILFLILLFLFSATTLSLVVQGYSDPLPRNFRIYINDKGQISNQFLPEYQIKILPTINLILAKPGCYIGCYTTSPNKAVYAAEEGVYIVGQIRVRGQYEGKICVPEDYENTDIGNEVYFRQLCSNTFNCIGNSCWANGDTGAWFALR